MKNNRLFPLLTICALLSACANTATQTWSDAQKTTLSSISTPSLSFADSAYQRPRAISSGETTRALSNGFYYGSTGNGTPIALIALGAGLLIDSSVAAVQQSKYNAKYSEYYPAIETLTKNNLTSSEATIAEEIKKVPYIAERLRNDSNNKLLVTVNKHGLTRYGKTTVDDMDLVYYVDAYITLNDANGESLLAQKFKAYSDTHKMDDILKDNNLLKKMQDSTYQSLGHYLASSIALKAKVPMTTVIMKIPTSTPITSKSTASKTTIP